MKQFLYFISVTLLSSLTAYCEEPAPEAAVITPVLEDSRLYWKGEDGCVRVVEYLDFQCPYCRANHPDIQALLTRYGGDICLYIKHLPVNKAHKFGFFLAAHYEAIRLQNPAAAQRFHDIAFENLNAPGGLGYVFLTRDAQIEEDKEFIDRVYDVIRALGVDVERVRIDWRSYDVRQKIEYDVREAVSLGAKETPFFWIEGSIYRGQQDYETLDSIIRSALGEDE